MIRKYREIDLTKVMLIWLDANIRTHNFIDQSYWLNNYDMVKEVIPQAEVYVYEDEVTKQIEGFIGLTDDYIAGLFVNKGFRSKGIGKELLNYVKKTKSNIRLNVYNKNVRAIEFYRREHFSIQTERMDDNTNEKELIMTWSR